MHDKWTRFKVQTRISVWCHLTIFHLHAGPHISIESLHNSLHSCGFWKIICQVTKIRCDSGHGTHPLWVKTDPLPCLTVEKIPSTIVFQFEMWWLFLKRGHRYKKSYFVFLCLCFHVGWIPPGYKDCLMGHFWVVNYKSTEMRVKSSKTTQRLIWMFSPIRHFAVTVL